MKTGIELITEERKEQTEKHGWSLEHDDIHVNNELIGTAIFLLTKNEEYFPGDWDIKYWNALQHKKGVEALKVAGALIAAEIDRLNRSIIKNK